MQDLNSVDSRAFIPPFLREAPFVVNPRDCQLTAKNVGTKTLFTYTLTWESETSGGENMSCETAKSSSAISKGSSRSASRSPRPTPYETVNNRNNCSSQMMVSCDGPCGKIYDTDELTSLGRCGHYLCKLCYGLIINTDGSYGCSAFSCTYQSLFEFLPEEYAKGAYDSQIRSRMLEKERRQKATFGTKKSVSRHSVGKDMKDGSNKSSDRSYRKKFGKSRSRSRSRGSESVTSLRRCFSDIAINSGHKDRLPDQCELLNVRLLVIELNYDGKIRKTHLTGEIPAYFSLKEAICEMLDYRQSYFEKKHPHPIRLFFCPGSGDVAIRDIKHLEYETALLEHFPAYNSNVHFVLDSANYVRK